MFKIRFVAPKKTDFMEVAGLDAAAAVGSLLEKNLDHCLFVRPENGSGSVNESGHYAVVEVEGLGPLVGRVFYSGIRRKGGVQVKNSRERTSLSEVERDLGLSAGMLSDAETEGNGEESTEEAFNRNFGRAAA